MNTNTCCRWVIMVCAVLVLLSACRKAFEESKTTTPSVSEDQRLRAEATIRFLADDLLEGRATPSRGLDVAALYLANELRAARWRPANGDSYMQTYSVKTVIPQQTRLRIAVNGVQLEPRDYVFIPSGLDPARTPVKYDLVFGGFGIYAPEKGIDDFAGVDIRGKAVISVFGAPWPLDPSAIHAYDRGIGKDVHVAVRNGALLVYVTEELDAPTPPSAEIALVRVMAGIPLSMFSAGGLSWSVGPALFLRPAAFDKTLAKVTGGMYAEWRKKLVAEEFKAKPVSASSEIRMEATATEGRASNVAAVYAGSDPQLKDEWIVLSPHYDHLGTRPAAPGEDGVFHGADDNASGTAAVLEVAKRLASGPPARRSVLAILTSGEEMGLLGSAYYSMHPLVPPERVVANINLDMVGRSDGTVIGIATGSDELFEKAAEFGRKCGINVLPDKHPTWRLVYFIDSYHFARMSLPFIEFATEMHKDYHQVSDTANLIRYDDLARIINVAYELTNHYAQGAPRPTFKRPTWFLTPDSPQ